MRSAKCKNLLVYNPAGTAMIADDEGSIKHLLVFLFWGTVVEHEGKYYHSSGVIRRENGFEITLLTSKEVDSNLFELFKRCMALEREITWWELISGVYVETGNGSANCEPSSQDNYTMNPE
jgi:hypothetical protein